MKQEARINLKLPSLNDYIRACRSNKYLGASLKKGIEAQIMPYIIHLKRAEGPVEIEFHWVEATRRRDLDNVAFAKKFILDALVKYGKLADDNRKCVTAFRDYFDIGKETYVEIKMEEIDGGTKNDDT